MPYNESEGLIDYVEITQATVCLELAQAEATERAAGDITMHEVSPVQFMITAIELQEHQCVSHFESSIDQA